MFLEFINTMASNKHSYSHLATFLYYLTNLSFFFFFFFGKMYPPPIVGHPLIKAGGRTFQKLSHLGGMKIFPRERG